MITLKLRGIAMTSICIRSPERFDSAALRGHRRGGSYIAVPCSNLWVSLLKSILTISTVIMPLDPWKLFTRTSIQYHSFPFLEDMSELYTSLDAASEGSYLRKQQQRSGVPMFWSDIKELLICSANMVFSMSIETGTAGWLNWIFQRFQFKRGRWRKIRIQPIHRAFRGD